MNRFWVRFWRRSLQARVVVSTIVLTITAVSVVGWFLVAQVRDGLLDHRVETAVAETEAEVTEAQNRLLATASTDLDASAQQRDLLGPIIQRGAARGFGVVMAGPISAGSGRISEGGAEFSPGLVTSSVPAKLEDHFVSGARSTAWSYTSIASQGSEGTITSVPGVAVGAEIELPADGGRYAVYFLYSLAEEEDTLGLVRRALITAGALLLVLMAATAWVATRHVVTPIRLARQAAERISIGELQERLVVHGEDDLGRLALSFNQMAGTLQRQIRQLEELSRLQRRFTSDVSHELRTPLTTVRMASEMLHEARERFDPASARAAELLLTEVDRFEQLLSDLLVISRFDAGVAVLESDDVDLLALTLRVVEGAQPLADKRGVRIRVIEPSSPCIAEADVRRVERIMRNLVTNAIDHATPEGGERGAEIEIELGSNETAAAVTVRDFGIGLAPGESAMVFNRFWRADPARARTTGGTGLGLAIALEDAALHGGWLQAWGQPGGGAVFRLTLPRETGAVLSHSPLGLVPAAVEPDQ